jgi:hypothetical protein
MHTLLLGLWFKRALFGCGIFEFVDETERRELRGVA